MGVTSGCRMNVHMDELGNTSGVPITETDVEAGFLTGLSSGGLPGALSRIDVTAGLQPHAQPLVPEEKYPTCANHNS